jgi:acyl dehydratase
MRSSTSWSRPRSPAIGSAEDPQCLRRTARITRGKALVTIDLWVPHEEGRAPSSRIPGAALQPLIENRTFDEIEVGESAALERRLTWRDIELFAVVSGDVNPAHVDSEYARWDRFHEIVAHGMWGASLISTLLGTQLPGPGTIYLEQTLRFRRPVTIGDVISVSVTVAAKDAERTHVVLDCRCVNQQGETVIDGTAKVLAPTEPVRRPRHALPDVSLREPGRSLWFG